MKPVKVAHLTSAHPDGDVRIFHKECVSLAKNGYDVTHIVPNTEKRTVKGVKIEPVFFSQKSRIARMQKAVNLVYKKAVEVDADIYHFHDPELLRIALRLKRRGKIVIYDTHEDTPRQILSKKYINPLVRKVISRAFEQFENYVSKRLSAIVTATPFINDRFKQINPVSVNISNFPLTSEIIKTDPPKKENMDSVCYIGGITEVRGIKEMVLAAGKSKTELKIAGKWPDYLLKKCSKLAGWEYVNNLGYCSREELLAIKNDCFAGLVVLLPEPNHINSFPIKMFEYMAAGLPVVSSNFPLWQEIIAKKECGICVDPNNPDEIAKAITYLKENPEKAHEMGVKARKIVANECNWDIEEAKLLKLYDQLLKQRD